MRDEGRGKREEGRGKREEGRGKRKEGRGKRVDLSECFPLGLSNPTSYLS
jgi:hypothetical protein